MSWRPSKLNEFVGQAAAIKMLEVWVKAATVTGEALPHMILYGHPGAGKTTIARLIAAERGVDFFEITGDSLRNRQDIFNLFKDIDEEGYVRYKKDPLHLHKIGLSRPTVLFIDEIHAISRQAAEVLYKPMEDFLWETDGAALGLRQNRVQAEMAPFTIVGATTDLGALPQPLIDRTETIYLEPYQQSELENIVIAHGLRSQWVSLDDDVIISVARQARSTPRIAVSLYRELNRWALAHEWDRIDAVKAKHVFDSIGIDANGLSRIDRRLLDILADATTPQGGDALAAKLNESKDNVGISERFLLSIGAIDITPRGRIITPHGRDLI